jgi:hypothetical protein
MNLVERLLPPELLEAKDELLLPGHELERLERLAHYPLPVLLGFAECSWTRAEKTAELSGLIPTIELDASSLLDHLHLASGPRDSEDSGEDLALLLIRFAAQILELKEELGADSRFCCRIVIDDRRLTLKIPTAAPFVRAVALIHAVFPSDNLEIETAPAWFGRHLSGLLGVLGLTTPGGLTCSGASSSSA